MSESHRRPWAIVISLVVVFIVLPVVYVGLYLAMLTQSQWVAFDADGYLLPEYRFGGKVAETVFYPAYRVDRMIRQDHWGGWNEFPAQIGSVPPPITSQPLVDESLELELPEVTEPVTSTESEDPEFILAMASTMLASEPNNVEFLMLRASAYEMQGKWSKALADYQTALNVSPEDHQTLGAAALLLAACPDQAVRDGDKAAEHAQKACEAAKWKEPNAVAALAAAYAELGDWEAAVDMQKSAIEKVGESRDALRKQLEERLALYEQEKPYRLPAPRAESSP